ncbi:MAG: hypothetical protein AB7L17_13635 [Ilumatobacteraceae bacterium]
MTRHTFRTPVRPWARLAGAVLVTTVALAACGGGDDGSTGADVPATTASPPTTPSPSSAPPTTVHEPASSRWDALLDQVGEDGAVTAQLAIDAFSLGIAPLPGSELVRGEGTDVVADVSPAMAWIHRHFDELSADQQSAVGAALSPPPALSGGSGLRRTAQPATGDTTGCYGQVVPSGDSPGAEQLRGMVDGMVAEIEGRLGDAITMVAPIHLLLDHRNLGLGLAYTWADPGECDQNGLASCTIHLSAEAEAESGADLRGIISHEVFHCFQFQYLGMSAYDMPEWILEGLPAWVGEDISGGSTVSTKWWTKYLTTPERSLYSRDYDAIGFYSHLDEVGIDPWSRVVQIFDGFSNEPAFEGAGASSGSFLESWPSSVLRRTDYGRAWDATGPGITIDRATPSALSVTSGGAATAAVGKVSGGLYDVAIHADLVTFQFEGWARMAAADGTDILLASGSTYCTRPDGCVCPGDSGPRYDPIAANVVVGLTGGTDTASMTILGGKVNCRKPETTETAPIVDPCLVGQWISTASYIDDTVTGAPVNELGGGAGIVMTVSPDGSFTMDFNASTPSSTDMGHGLILSSQTIGVAHGHITATNGNVELIDADYRDSLTTRMTGGGTLPGGTGIGTGTYSCTAGRAEFHTPFELGETINAFQSA